MSHYEARLERDLNNICRQIQDLGVLIEKALENSGQAVLLYDRALAYETILGDQLVNRRVKEIDRLCHFFVARHLPSARHLRFIASVIRINIALERIGDYSVTICREAARISKSPADEVVRDLEKVMGNSRLAVTRALKALADSDVDLAGKTKELISGWASSFDRVFDDLVQEGRQRSAPVRDLFSLLVIFNRLSRVCDQAQNICEDTIFIKTGETKAQRGFRVLFLDRENSCWSQIAAAIAGRTFPPRIQHASAGWDPAGSMPPGLIEFLDRRGHSVRENKPEGISLTSEALDDFDIVVSFDDGLQNRLPVLPYDVVGLEWRVAQCPDETDSSEETIAQYQAVYREIAELLSDLVDTLSGDRES